jgi:hypothetical protein
LIAANLPPAVNGNILNSNTSQLPRRGLILDEYKKRAQSALKKVLRFYRITTIIISAKLLNLFLQF